MASGCCIEISYIDPQTYTSVVNHGLRKVILQNLYGMSLDGPVTKQALAERVGIGYHQLIYQLNHQLADFWTVAEERKVRGTRMELIRPSKPSSIFITLGKEGGIFMVDPLAALFGPLAKVGTRCDGCARSEVERCLSYVRTGCCFAAPPSEQELAVLQANGRGRDLRPVDLAILCALKGVATGRTCAVSIPCNACPFLTRLITIK